MLVVAVCCLSLAIPATGLAQGNSAVDQYVEQVPDAGGKKPADKPGSGQGAAPSNGGSGGSGGGSSSGGSSDGGSGSGSSGSGSGSSGSGDSGDSGDSKDKKKANEAREKKEQAEDAARDEAESDSAADLANANVPPTDGGGGDGGGGFPITLLVIFALLAGAAGIAYWKFGPRRGGGGPQPTTD